jgi:hypothetical protein
LFVTGCGYEPKPHLPKCEIEIDKTKYEVQQWACFPKEFDKWLKDVQIVYFYLDDIPLYANWMSHSKAFGYKIRVKAMLERLDNNFKHISSYNDAQYKEFTKSLKLITKGSFDRYHRSYRFNDNDNNSLMYVEVLFKSDDYIKRVATAITQSTKAYIKHYKLDDKTAKEMMDTVNKTIKSYYEDRVYPPNVLGKKKESSSLF